MSGWGWLMLAGVLGLGLWVRWGNKRLMAGRRPPEESATFGVILLAICAVAVWYGRHVGVL